MYNKALTPNEVGCIYDNRNYISNNEPVDLSGLQMWFDSMNIDGQNNDTLTDGDRVFEWNDRRYYTTMTGATRHYADRDSDVNSNNAIFKLINGKPTVRFVDGSGLVIKNRNDSYNTNVDVIANSPYTVVMYVRRLHDKINSYPIMGEQGATNRALHVGWRNNSTFTYDQHATQEPNRLVSTTPVYVNRIRVTSGGFHVTLDEIEIWVNGVNIASAREGGVAACGNPSIR